MTNERTAQPRQLREAQTAAPKSARIDARLTGEQKDIVTRAAELTGRSLSDFIIASAYENALRTIREHQVITLSANEGRAFISALADPPQPNTAARKAAARYLKSRSA
jgi:uncharacterized protein (DUF1778 family)